MTDAPLSPPHSQPAPLTRSNDKPSWKASEKPLPVASDRARRKDDPFADSWAWECACVVLSVGAFIGICVSVSVFEGRQLPDWPLGITLNALISFLSTLSKAALLIPVAQSLAQTKWIHFERAEHPLFDLQLLDDASRGALGSIKCVYKRRGGFIPFVGAVIFVLAILLDPFTQQVLAYPSRQVEQPDMASLSKSVVFDPPNAGPIWKSVYAASYAGLMEPNTSYAPAGLACPTGNCDWPPYTQLGVCADTVDISSLVHINCSLPFQPGQSISKTTTGAPFCSVAIPNKNSSQQLFPLVIFNRDEIELLSVAGSIDPAQVLASPGKRSQFPGGSAEAQPRYQWIPITGYTNKYFTSMYTVYKSGSSLISPTNFTGFFMATQTLFSFCAQTVKVKVDRGIPNVSRWNTFVPPQPEYADIDLNFTAPGAEDTFKLNGFSLSSLANMLPGVINSSEVASVMFQDVKRTNYELPDIEPFPDGPGSRTWMPAHLDIISRTADGLAASLTNNIQSRGNITVTGSAFVSQTYVHIRWRWLALHCCLIVIGLLLLAYIIWKSSRTHVGCWKSSIWPNIFLVDDQTRYHLGGLAGSSASFVDKRSNKIKVQNTWNESRWTAK